MNKKLIIENLSDLFKICPLEKIHRGTYDGKRL